jgi:hypothetical protein
MSKAFISYARKDADVASLFRDRLRDGRVSVFMDESSLVAGEDVLPTVQQQLSDADIVLVILSRNSSRSKWVQEGLRNALKVGESKRIVPVLLDEAARDNWVWPLIADRQVALVRPECRYEDVDEIVDGLIAHPDEPSQDCRAG